MAILGCFIGVDRYSDAKIRDLNGARRDATALFSLFRDTLGDFKARFLVDGDATVEGVRAGLAETLGEATRDDTVIVSISSHGTKDHRIALHDTMLENIPGSTISMDVLASYFKRTQARAVLIILDCCFSGGAPARVIEDSPASRDPNSGFEEIAGNGRILLAASKATESALEIPSARHGLLTKVLIDVLRSGEGTVSLTDAVDRIMHLVRSEAARMGYEQTPVMLGHVEGGLVMPALRPGKNYYEAFPELKGLRVGEDLRELGGFGIPLNIIEAWQEQHGGNRLNGLQQAAVNEHRVLDGESVLVVAPTTSGKTFVGEMAAARAVVGNRKAVFLFPYKSLVNEKFDQFTRTYRDGLGMRVVRCSGDFQDQTTAFFKGKYDIAVLTFETFLSFSLSGTGLLNQIGLVVVDEAQFITDPRRGIVVEMIFTHLLAARERGVCPQLVALSAVIGDINDFDAWLKVGKLVTKERPVPLQEGVLDRSGCHQFLDTSGKTQTEQLLPSGRIVQRRDKPSGQDVIVPLVKQLLIRKEERVVVFRNSRGAAQGCAKYLAEGLGLESADNAILSLPGQDLSTSSDALRTCLSGGTAFHTADLSREEREVVEREFRLREGSIRVVAATTTIAAGINTPASTVILAENEFQGEEGRPFTIAEYKNMAGRAGRLGFQEMGKSILLADTAMERASLFSRYVKGEPEPLRSSFASDQLETWLIRLLAQSGVVEKLEVTRLVANTYAGFLSIRGNPSWRGQMEERVARIVSEMIRLGLLDEEESKVQLSLLGKVCGQSLLSFASAMRLVGVLREWQGPVTAETLMILVQGLSEMDGVPTPVIKKGQKESRWPREVSQRFGGTLARVLQRYATDNWSYYARCKRAMILDHYISGAAMSAIEENASVHFIWGKVGAGSVRGIADATRLHLVSAWKIATVLLLNDSPAEEGVEKLLKRLEFGLPEEAVGLLELPMQLGRGEYLALCEAGLRTVEAIWSAPGEKLEQALTVEQRGKLEAFRPAGK